MNQLTKKMLLDNQPLLSEVSASECEAVTGGFDDVPFCGSTGSKIPLPYPIRSMNFVNPAEVLIR